ncbi:hypothetical protein [Aeromonas rivipollensis]
MALPASQPIIGDTFRRITLPFIATKVDDHQNGLVQTPSENANKKP